MTAIYRLTLPIILIAMIAAILWQWHLAVGFDALDLRWWQWSLEAATHSAGLPNEMLYPALGTDPYRQGCQPDPLNPAQLA